MGKLPFAILAITLVAACGGDGASSTRQFAGSGGSGGGGASGNGGVAGSGGSAGSSSGGASACQFSREIICWGGDLWFPQFEDGCSGDADCTLVIHTSSCCGDQRYLGVNHGAVECFRQAEGTCTPQYPLCACASMGATTEDGALVPWPQVDGIVVECVQGACQSRWGGNSFACGSATCIDGQYCSTLVAGPAGAPPSYACQQLPGGCSDCTCVNSTGCTCGIDNGHLVVTCYAP